MARAEEPEAEGLAVVMITHDFRARVRSYELLAAAFDLPGVSTPTDKLAVT